MRTLLFVALLASAGAARADVAPEPKHPDFSDPPAPLPAPPHDEHEHDDELPKAVLAALLVVGVGRAVTSRRAAAAR